MKMISISTRSNDKTGSPATSSNSTWRPMSARNCEHFLSSCSIVFRCATDATSPSGSLAPGPGVSGILTKAHPWTAPTSPRTCLAAKYHGPAFRHLMPVSSASLAGVSGSARVTRVPAYPRTAARRSACSLSNASGSAVGARPYGLYGALE